MKAIGYVRVSSDKQCEDGVSLDAQRDKVNTYAKLHDLELVELCADEGISGKRADNRPGLQRALKLACQHKAVLVVYSLSRLARSVRDCIDISERLQHCGASLASLTERLDTSSASGEFFFHVMASLAQMERKQIGERTRLGIDFKRKRGERIGNIPIGYRLADDGVKLIEDEREQATIKIMQRLRADGLSYAKIAATLNERSVQAKHGGRWFFKTVYGALNRPNA